MKMKTEQQNKDLMRRAVRHLLVTDDDVMNEKRLTHDRLFIYYSTKDGKKKRQTYLVWTPKGLEFIRSLIKGKGKNNSKQVKRNGKDC
jgi:hypothetical protein